MMLKTVSHTKAMPGPCPAGAENPQVYASGAFVCDHEIGPSAGWAAVWEKLRFQGRGSGLDKTGPTISATLAFSATTRGVRNTSSSLRRRTC